MTHESPPTNPRILIVDDDEDMRLYMRGCLRRLGIRHTLEASNGDEALVCAGETALDLIISDVVMPVMDGYELYRRLKSDASFRDVQVLLVTGETPDPPIDIQADAFLEKPFNTETLRERVTALLDFQ